MATTDHYNLVKPAYTDAADIGDINDNMDKIDTALYGMKPKQTAVSSPTASGTANAFIDTISQNADGKITATKKTVAVSNAGVTLAWGTSKTIGSVAGTNLTVTLPSNPVSKSTVDSALGAGSGTTFYRKDGTWATPSVSKSQVDSAIGAGSGSTFYKKDGTWANPVSKSAVDSALGAGSGSTFYRKDGTWATPTNTNTWRGYQVKDYTFSSGSSVIALDPGSSADIKASDLNVSTPSGYTPVAVVKFDTGTKHCHVFAINGKATGSSTIMQVKNTSSSIRTLDPAISILYLQTGSP